MRRLQRALASFGAFLTLLGTQRLIEGPHPNWAELAIDYGTQFILMAFAAAWVGGPR